MAQSSSSSRGAKPGTGPPLALIAAAYGAVFLGGAAALIHEVAWSRLFVLVVGSSADSATVILVGFMGGFGLGAWLAGRFEKTFPRPLLLFLSVQLLVALYGLGLFTLVTRWLPAVTVHAAGSAGAAWLMRILFSLVMVLVPAALMGMTTPLLLRGLAAGTGDGESAGAAGRLNRWSAALVALSTAGACLGTLLAGYVLVPRLGLRLSCTVASGFNLAAALAAVSALTIPAVRRRPGRPLRKPAPNDAAPPAPRSAEDPVPLRPALHELAALAVGAYVLAMEILWRRVLVMAFGHDTYGMTAMLFIVITGLAAGGGLGYGLLRLMPGRGRPAAGILLMATSLLTPLALWAGAMIVLRAPTDPFGLIGVPSQTTALYGGLLQQLAVSAVTVGPPSLAAGAVMPLLCGELAHRRGPISLPLARLLLFNYAGSLAGAAAAAFFLIALLGISGSTVLVGLVPAVAGAALLTKGRTRRRLAAALIVIAACALFLLVRADLPRRLFLRTAGGAHLSLLYYQEGRTATVGVTRDGVDGERQLLINGVNEVSDRFVHDQSFALLGHLGMLLHPDPRRVLIISYGGGITAGAAATHNPDSLTTVDLVREVLGASEHFGDLNGRVLDSGLLRVVIEDGRFYLASSPDPCDVIIIDSTHPRSVDSWLLYTRQFYESVAGKLSAGDGRGLMVQWVPMHGMSSDEFKIILATFLSVFPHGQLWANVGYDARGFSGYALLAASASAPLEIDLYAMAARIEGSPAVKESLGRWYLDTPEEIMDCFVAAGQRLRTWTAGLPIMDDDQPVIPFVSSYSLAAKVHPSLLTQVLQDRDLPLRPDEAGRAAAYLDTLPLRHLSMGHLLRGDEVGAEEKLSASRSIKRYVQEKLDAAAYYGKLAASFPQDRKSVLLAIRSLRGLGEVKAALQAARKAALTFPDDAAVLFELALCLEYAGSDEKAIPLYGRVLALQPKAVPAMNNLALLLGHKEQFVEALTLLKRSSEIDPLHPATWVAMGRVQIMRREFSLALKAFERALALQPGDAQTHNAMGLALTAMGRYGPALGAFKKTSALDPFWEDPYFNGGLALFSQKRFSASLPWFERAVLLDPHDSEFWRYLGMTLSALSRWSDAIEPFLMSLQLNAESDLAWLHLGFAYRSLDNDDEARQCFENALRINPDLAGQILQKGGGGLGGP